MNLLSQRKVHELKQEETRQAIHQGMELANRVDALRKAVLDEERNLAQQRDSMIKALNQELGGIRQQIEQGKSELVRIQDERRKALEPLNERWEELNRAEAVLQERSIAFDEEKANLLKRERSLQIMIDKADKNIDDSEEMKAQAAEVLKRRQLQLEEVQRITSNLNANIDAMERDREALNRHYAERERRLQIRERELELRVENINKREREINLHAASLPKH